MDFPKEENIEKDVPIELKKAIILSVEIKCHVSKIIQAKGKIYKINLTATLFDSRCWKVK